MPDAVDLELLTLVHFCLPLFALFLKNLILLLELLYLKSLVVKCGLIRRDLLLCALEDRLKSVDVCSCLGKLLGEVFVDILVAFRFLSILLDL